MGLQENPSKFLEGITYSSFSVLTCLSFAIQNNAAGLFFFFSIVVNSYRIHHLTHLFNSVVFNIYTECSLHHHYQIQNIFRTLNCLKYVLTFCKLVFVLITTTSTIWFISSVIHLILHQSELSLLFDIGMHLVIAWFHSWGNWGPERLTKSSVVM